MWIFNILVLFVPGIGFRRFGSRTVRYVSNWRDTDYRIDSEVSLDSLMFGYLCLVFSSCYSAFQHDVSAITANSGLSFPKSEPKPNFEVDHREFYFWSSNFWSKKNIKVCTGAVPQKIARGFRHRFWEFFSSVRKNISSVGSIGIY